MPLIKTLSQTLKQDKEKFKVPRSVQQAIPIRKIWPDGIFQVESKFPGHSGLRISIIPLPVKRTRQKCSWIIPNF